MEQCVIGHYEASEARKVALCENKEKNGTKEGERDFIFLCQQNAMGDASLCLIGRRYEHVDKYFNDV